MKILSQFASVGAALLLASTSASAIVTTWDYNVSSLFTSATYSGGTGTTTTPPATTLSWGTPSGQPLQSSLQIGSNPAAGKVDTYLGLTPPQVSPYLANSTSLTHHNNVIAGGSSSLLSAILTNTVTLTPFIPSLGALPVQIVPFNIAFTETPNTAGNCAATSPPGNPCNDIFVLTGGLLNFFFDYDAIDGDGLKRYYVNIFPTTGGALSTLSPSACGAANQQAGCIGFTTIEGQENTLAFGFTISTQPLQVPEPGMLALFGVGLMSLVFLRRRRPD